MINIAVGIPTLNEASNIVELTRKIDFYASQLKINIIIINSDNSSLDNTAELFRSVKTANRKISLSTVKTGKGRNVRKILKEVVKNNIDYCFLIDGDVKSLEIDWLKKHVDSAKKGSDYVVPNYARYLQEGNTTNHFVYPALSSITNQQSPRQPIAGDFGLSKKFTTAFVQYPWSNCVLGYGIDIHMTMFALSGGFKVREIALDKKIHKPSFGKMVEIFHNEACAYFSARETMKFNNINFVSSKKQQLLDGPSIAKSQITIRRQEARQLFAVANNICQDQYEQLPIYLSSKDWAEILIKHEKQVAKMKPEIIANSLCPYFLVRTISYLEDAKNSSIAQQIIDTQLRVIYKKYAEARL